MIPDGWVFTWCDDTTHQPQLFRRLHENIVAHPSVRAFVFKTELLPVWPKTTPEIIFHGMQVAWHRSILQPTDRLNFGGQGAPSDIDFFKKIYLREPEKFYFVDEQLIRVNNLWPHKFWPNEVKQ